MPTGACQIEKKFFKKSENLAWNWPGLARNKEWVGFRPYFQVQTPRKQI